MPYRQIGLICPSESVHYLVDYLKKLRFDVRALWTPEPDLTIQASAEHEIPFSASRPDEVLLKKEVQMIVITGRPQIHSKIAIKALGIGKHVLCDAPVTLNCSDATKMVQAAQYYPQLLAVVGFGLRHLPVFRRARELIAQGYVGEAIACECSVQTGALLSSDHYDWLWEHSMGGGILNLVGCHVIDIISYLTQRRATRVQGLVKCSGLATTANGRGYAKSTADDDDSFLWMNGNNNNDHSDEGQPPSSDEKKRSSSTNAGVGFRRVNAEDFASFLLKFDNDFVATVTLNALSISAAMNSTVANGGSDDHQTSTRRPYFRQRLLISGTDGQLEILDHEIYGMKFRSSTTTTDKSIPDKNRSSTNDGMQLLFSDDTHGHPNSIDDHLRATVPDFYVKGFLNLLHLLAETLPAYEQQQQQNQSSSSSSSSSSKIRGGDHSAISWQTGALASLASFEDAQYVRAVIDAVRHSSEKGDWIKVDLHQHDDGFSRRK